MELHFIPWDYIVAMIHKIAIIVVLFEYLSLTYCALLLFIRAKEIKLNLIAGLSLEWLGYSHQPGTWPETLMCLQ